jgi:hypothetical protein
MNDFRQNKEAASRSSQRVYSKNDYSVNGFKQDQDGLIDAPTHLSTCHAAFGNYLDLLQTWNQDCNIQHPTNRPQLGVGLAGTGRTIVR